MYTIRRASITDLPVIRYLWSLYAIGVSYPRDQIEDIDLFTRGLAAALAVSEDPTVFVFLAEEDGEAIGFLMSEIQRRAIGQPHRYGFCSYLYTLPEHRRRGIALELLDVSIAMGLSRGITEIELNATPDDHWNLPMGQGVNWHPLQADVEGASQSPFAHSTVAVRQATTVARVIAWIDQQRGRQPAPNGHDQEAPLTPEPEQIIADLDPEKE